MAINKKLIHFQTLDNFKAQLSAGNILDTSICFIKDAKLIYTHGQYYDCGSAAYPQVNHGTSDTAFTLTPNTFHVWGIVSSLTLTLGGETSGVANEYLFQFSCASGEATTLSLPSSVMWANGETPTIEVMKTYQVSILNDCATILSFG